MLLIGDSITEGYQAGVRARLKGIACVDCVATSYGVDMPIYHEMLAAVAADASYAVVQYNFGLHAFRLDGAAYEKGYAAMLDRLAGRSRVVVATSTRALNEARDDDDEAWRVKLAERNAIVKRLAAERNLIVNDLGALSQTVPTGYFLDHVHYRPEGYDLLAEQTELYLRQALRLGK